MKVRPYNPAADEVALQANAQADEHVVIAPTHVVEDDTGRIVGYGSIGAVALVNVWLDSQRVNARESVMLLGRAEEIARTQGLEKILMPCAHTSPFIDYMDKLGFDKLGYSSLNLKDLKEC